MNPSDPGIDRRTLLSTVLLSAMSAPLLSLSASAQTATSGSALSSWNDGPAKQSVLDFVRDTTDRASSKFLPPDERVATFDQDGTLWVEHPVYSQMMYCLDRVPMLAKEEPALKKLQPFKTVISGDREAIAKLPLHDLEKTILVTLSGMTTDEFEAEVRKWLATAKDPRWKRPYTELVYQPMQELMVYLRANGFKTYIVTGFGQDFVRLYSQRVYGIPPEQVVGSALAVKYAYDKGGKPILIKQPKLMLNDNDAGKPEGIHLMIGSASERLFRQLDRRQADAGIHGSGRRRAPVSAGAARRCDA